jgi:serine protease AprX
MRTMLGAKLPKASTQKYKNAKGGGSIDAARGSARVAADGVVIRGEIDIFGRRIDTRSLAAQQKQRLAWNGGIWNGSTWSGSSWSGSSWSGSSWSGSSWSGSSWSGSSWSGSSWSGSSWSGAVWSTARWG